jgi:MinD superfamily P-loop ATPase
MRELVIISGKGGVGKTSVTAAFAALAGKSVIVDCDVDAADMHLLMRPEILRREQFVGGKEAIIRSADCTGCGICLEHCRFGAIRRKSGQDGRMVYHIEPVGCEGCGVCVWQCPAGAIDFPERVSGEWYVSDTRFGPMVHARLNPGGENSGKLVARIRKEARDIGHKEGLDLALIDGPPGIGCAVIASITGASQVVIVTEPTLAGRHDLQRVLDLALHFNIPAVVCVNKWDINPELTEMIETEARHLGAHLAGRIRYDRSITDAQLQCCSVVEYNDGSAATDLREIWNGLHEF